EDTAYHAEHGEVVARPDLDCALRWIGGLQDHRGAAMRERLYRGLGAQPRRHHVTILGARRGRDHYEVSVHETSADHAVAFHLEEEHVLAGNESPIDRDEVLSMLREQRRLAGVDFPVVRHRLRVSRRREAKQTHAARARFVAL